MAGNWRVLQSGSTAFTQAAALGDTVRTWIKCTDANGQIIHVNLHNATTLFRDEVRHRGTIIGFIGPTDALTVRETPDEILKAAEG
jgi:hypothetical protein